jgi:hypothetical protein
VEAFGSVVESGDLSVSEGLLAVSAGAIATVRAGQHLQK